MVDYNLSSAALTYRDLAASAYSLQPLLVQAVRHDHKLTPDPTPSVSQDQRKHDKDGRGRGSTTKTVEGERVVVVVRTPSLWKMRAARLAKPGSDGDTTSCNHSQPPAGRSESRDSTRKSAAAARHCLTVGSLIEMTTMTNKASAEGSQRVLESARAPGCQPAA